MPTPDAPDALRVAEMIALLERRSDGSLPLLWLAAAARNDKMRITAIKRSPTSIQVAYHMRLCACGGDHSACATVDLPLLPLADLTPERLVGFTTRVREADGGEALVVQTPAREDLDMLAVWLAQRRQIFAGRGHQDEGDDNGQ